MGQFTNAVHCTAIGMWALSIRPVARPTVSPSAIAHNEDEIGVLDAVREIKPPFSPEGVVSEFADLCKSYGSRKVTGDRYAGEWPREQFAKRGIKYEPSERSQGHPLSQFLAADQLGQGSAARQPAAWSASWSAWRRNTARGGKDSIDHARGAHDDVANAVAGALLLATEKRPQMRSGAIAFGTTGQVTWNDPAPRTHSRIRWITVDKNGNEVRR